MLNITKYKRLTAYILILLIIPFIWVIVNCATDKSYVPLSRFYRTASKYYKSNKKLGILKQ